MIAEIFGALKERWKVFGVSLAGVGIAAIFLMNYVSLPGLLQGEILVPEGIDFWSVLFISSFIFLGAIAITLNIKGLEGKKIRGVGFAGMFAGVFTSACPICYPLVLTAAGIPTALAILPFGGAEVKAASIGLLIVSVYFSARSLACKPKL